jgi:D-3-phosphoglycerate dehydrogenase
MTGKTIVIEQSFGDPSIEREAAAEYGVSLTGKVVTNPAELAAAAKDADGIIVRYLKVDRAMMQAARWKVIGRYGIGVDNVDLPAASELGIAVINVPDYCVEEVAEHTAALVYAGWRGLRTANNLVLADRWTEWQEIGEVRRMSSSTLGLVGVGRIGSEVARLLRPAFGRVVVYDPVSTTPPPGTESVGLDELLAISDVVSLHCPLTPETRQLMNSRRFGMMKRNSILVNVSRGELVDIDALPAALDVRRPALAMLDVLPQEPPARGAAILSHPRVFLTPHVAWLSSASIDELRAKVAARTAAYLVGKPGVSVVNQKALEARVA